MPRIKALLLGLETKYGKGPTHERGLLQKVWAGSMDCCLCCDAFKHDYGIDGTLPFRQNSPPILVLRNCDYTVVTLISVSRRVPLVVSGVLSAAPYLLGFYLFSCESTYQSLIKLCEK